MHLERVALTLEGVALGEVLAAVLVPGSPHLAPAPDVRDRVHHPAVQEAKPEAHRRCRRRRRRRRAETGRRQIYQKKKSGT